MRLLRVELTDFRGIDHADIRFDPDGVTVVEGPNEVGKSSIAEAIGLIRRYQDSSKAKDVLDAQPAGTDVGPQVEVEVTTDAYHFVYRKRFVKRPRTELEVHAPRREQLTGREAHERVEAIFTETLDPQLWDALQMVQGESFQQPVLARITPLRSALGSHEPGAGDAGGHQDLLDRIEVEYATYFTPTGRQTGAYASAAATVEKLSDERAHLESRLAGVDERLVRYEANADRLERLEQNAARSAVELEALRRRDDLIGQLQHRADDAAHEHTRTRERRDAAAAAVEARRQLVADLRRRVDEHKDAGVAAAASRKQMETVQERIDDAFAAADADTERVRAREHAYRDATETLASARDARELTQVRARVARARQAQQERDDARARLEAHTVDDEAVDELVDAQAAVLTAEAVRDAAAARIRIEGGEGAGFEVDGVTMAGEYDEPVRQETTIAVPGSVTVRVTPGRDPRDLSEQLAAARERWRCAQERFAVDGLDEARASAAGRRDIVERLERAETGLASALGDDRLEDLDVRCRVLADRLGVIADGGGEAEVGTIDAAEQAVENARADLARSREAAEESGRLAHQRERDAATARAEHVRLQQVADGADGEIGRVTERLGRARSTADDATLRSRLDDAEADLTKATDAEAEAVAALTDERPDDLRILLDNEAAKMERFAADRRQVEDEQQQLLGQLADIEREGVRDQYDALRSELEDAEREHARMHNRACAARLLRDTMNRHLAASQQRYVAPFRGAVERLGRIVFGPEFTVEITPELAIESRTLDGVTVPFGSLSGGAKEQLAVIGRLACAQLVSAADGAPVVLDDSLGFSDPVRLQRLAAVLNEVGRHAQIIILTCQPERFGSIGSARLVRMPAADAA